MTEQHPLTDKICEDLSSCIGEPDPSVYKEYIEEVCVDMRAAADWQLEQVVQAWEQCMEYPGSDIQAIRRFDQMLKAMRPTQEG